MIVKREYEIEIIDKRLISEELLWLILVDRPRTLGGVEPAFVPIKSGLRRGEVRVKRA